MFFGFVMCLLCWSLFGSFGELVGDFWKTFGGMSGDLWGTLGSLFGNFWGTSGWFIRSFKRLLKGSSRD